MSVQEEFSELVNPMIFPIIHPSTQVGEGFIPQLAINSRVGLLEYSIRCLDPGGKICFCFLVCIRLISKILKGLISYWERL